jgi:chromosome segregation ATPase
MAMNKIPRTKKLEVALYYTLGLSYREIEDKTLVSHGSIVAIVKELESGKLDMPGTPFDQVNDLRGLSSDLKKKGLSSSQALLGVSFFERLIELGIGPEQIGKWAELVNRFASPDFPVKDFFESAARLYQLERNEGKSFEVLTEEYTNIEDKTKKLKTEIGSLALEGQRLSEEVHSLTSQELNLKKTTQELGNSKVKLFIELEDIESETREAKEERNRLNKELEELRKRLVKLSSEVDGKEASLIRLNDIGFRDEDLLRLRALIERIAQDSGTGQDDVKERFFAALGTLKDVTELQKSQAEETLILKSLSNKKSLLTGEIAGLEKQRDILRGEISESANSAVKQIADAGQNAVTQLQQQASDIKSQFDSLFAEAMRVAGVVGEMNTMVKKGEESGKSLDTFIEEVKLKLEKN